MADIRLYEYKRLLEQSRNELIKLRQNILDLHTMSDGGASSGMVSGYCEECDTVWPCKTWHIASGFGAAGYRKCWKQKYCEHEGMRW